MLILIDLRKKIRNEVCVVYTRFLLLILFSSALFGQMSNMGFSLSEGALKGDTNVPKSDSVTQKDYEILSKKPLDELSVIESYLMGLWYFGGSKKLHIKINKAYASKYLLDAYKKGYIRAAPHYIASEFELEKKNVAITFLNELLRDNGIDKKTKAYSIQVAIDSLIDKDEFKQAFIYIKYLADILDIGNAKIMLALNYFQGIGVQKNLKLANYYLNNGCMSSDLDEYSKATCRMFENK